MHSLDDEVVGSILAGHGGWRWTKTVYIKTNVLGPAKFFSLSFLSCTNDKKEKRTCQTFRSKMANCNFYKMFFFILAQKFLGCISAEKCQMSISNFQIDHYDRLIDGSTFLGSQFGAGWNFKNGRLNRFWRWITFGGQHSTN